MKQSRDGFVFVEENKRNLNSRGPWWKSGVQLFSEVSTWIALPIILALTIGKSLDSHYGTKPVIFLISVGVAFLVSSFKIYKTVKDYMKKLSEIEKIDKK